MSDKRDTTPLRFGKYKGSTPEEIAVDDPAYVVWLFDNVNPCPVSKTLALACEDDAREVKEDEGWDAHKGLR